MSQARLAVAGPDLRGSALGYIYANLGPGPMEREVHSNVRTEEPVFQRLTGFFHQDLVNLWKTKPGYSTCGDFVGHYCTSLGLQWLGLLSATDCRAYCEALGKGIAWIPNGIGMLPRSGDVFKQSNPPRAPNHVGVSVALEGDVWWTAEGGQGQPPTYDSVKKKCTNRLDYGVQGWVDLELWREANDKRYPIPQWLLGFWMVTYQSSRYYYHFGSDRRVAYTIMPSQARYLPSVNVSIARYAVTGLQSVTILWCDAGGYIERFQLNSGTTDRMTGSMDWIPNMLFAEKIPDINRIIGPFMR